MRPRIGQRLLSTVDTTGVVVIRWPDADLVITCGGAEMVDAASATGQAEREDEHSGSEAGAQLGKRYVAEALGVEVLCTKGGAGPLAVNGQPLTQKQAKPLPASD